MARTLYAAGLRRSRDDPDRIWREGLQIERKLLRLVRSGNVAQRFGGAQVSKRVLSGSTESMHPVTVGALFVLQIFHVLFLSLHDWIPLGNLNDPKAVRATIPGHKLLAATLISTAPFAFGLAASTVYLAKSYPNWLLNWLGISYAILFLGELQAWWIPYLFFPKPARAARYQAMFGGTHAFLPVHNAIRPNTLHVILHIGTLAILFVLAVLMAQEGKF